MEDLFYRALKWVLDASASVVETTMVGIVLNALSHMQGTPRRHLLCVMPSPALRPAPPPPPKHVHAQAHISSTHLPAREGRTR